MKQLVELQSQYQEFKDLGAEILAVSSEDKKGVEGLKLTQQKSKAEFTLLADLDKTQTARYSTTGYETYIIDKSGKIRAALGGSKAKRPSAPEIMAALKAALAATE